MLARLSAGRPAGSGSTLSDHWRPFQCSATGSCLVDPSVAPPTAQQFSSAWQDTPLRNVSADPGAFGLAVSDHFLPFQCSIKVRVTPEAVWSPTAQQEPTCGQLTLLRIRPDVAAAAVGGAPAGVTASRAAAIVRSRIMS
jgi:hypothetical protein